MTAPRSVSLSTLCPGWRCPRAGHGRTGRGPFSNGCKVPLQGPHRFWICGINPQLGIVSELRHLAGESEIQVIDIDGKRRGPKTDPWRTPLLTAVQSEGTPLMTPFASFLPTNSQFRQEHCLGCLEPSS